MVNKVCDAVIVALHEQFGDDYHYYKEDTEQNVRKPCFVVRMMKPESRLGRWRTYNRMMPLVVHYFTDDGDEHYKDCYEKAETLMETVEYITVDGTTIAGKDLEFDMVEGVLEVFVTYNFFTNKVVPVDPDMEVMNSDIGAIS